jgi:hypothetical protein
MCSDSSAAPPATVCEGAHRRSTDGAPEEAARREQLLHQRAHQAEQQHAAAEQAHQHALRKVQAEVTKLTA